MKPNFIFYHSKNKMSGGRWSRRLASMLQPKGQRLDENVNSFSSPVEKKASQVLTNVN